VYECDYRWDFGLMIGFIGPFDIARNYTNKSLSHTDLCYQFVTVFICLCLVAASNGERSTSCGFPNYPRPQLPASHSNSSQRLNCSSSLTNSTNSSITPLANSSLTVLRIISRHGLHRKHRSSVAVYGPVSSCLFRTRCLATGLHATVCNV
jgi:hypothetical protein